MSKEKNIDKDRGDGKEEVSLVPLYSPLDVSRGLQAYRRGNVVLYTVRGEPAKIMELIEELDSHGINEIVALVSHRSDQKTQEEGTTAIVKTGNGRKAPPASPDGAEGVEGDN